MDSLDGITTRLRAEDSRVLIPAQASHFSLLPNVQSSFVADPTPCLVGGGLFFEGKATTA